VPLRNPTPRERLCDAEGRPYFLWDTDITLGRFEELLRTGDRATRAYLVAKLMRQAKPDDVFEFVGLEQIRELWSELQHDLGRSTAFWHWILRRWGAVG
jgi:hypothetical protein